MLSPAQAPPLLRPRRQAPSPPPQPSCQIQEDGGTEDGGRGRRGPEEVEEEWGSAFVESYVCGHLERQMLHVRPQQRPLLSIGGGEETAKEERGEGGLTLNLTLARCSVWRAGEWYYHAHRHLFIAADGP